tara:strand:+ start:316 stop:699 length:384 start_codon:yes stop_codon:yes gene_type:complete
LNVKYVTVFKTEYDAPVAGYLDAPKTFEVSFQRVKVVSRFIEVLRSNRYIQKSKDILDYFKLIRSNSTFIISLIKPFKAPVLKRLDHYSIVPCIDTCVKIPISGGYGEMRKNRVSPLGLTCPRPAFG